MTLEEARRLRADRLARCRARAEALGYRIEESVTGYGFHLLARGEELGSGRRPEAGLPEIEGLLDELEKETTHA
jgi:hypothetical protein